MKNIILQHLRGRSSPHTSSSLINNSFLSFAHGPASLSNHSYCSNNYYYYYYYWSRYYSSYRGDKSQKQSRLQWAQIKTSNNSNAKKNTSNNVSNSDSKIESDNTIINTSNNNDSNKTVKIFPAPLNAAVAKDFPSNDNNSSSNNNDNKFDVFKTIHSLNPVNNDKNNTNSNENILMLFGTAFVIVSIFGVSYSILFPNNYSNLNNNNNNNSNNGNYNNTLSSLPIENVSSDNNNNIENVVKQEVEPTETDDNIKNDQEDQVQEIAKFIDNAMTANAKNNNNNDDVDNINDNTTNSSNDNIGAETSSDSESDANDSISSQLEKESNNDRNKNNNEDKVEESSNEINVLNNSQYEESVDHNDSNNDIDDESPHYIDDSTSHSTGLISVTDLIRKSIDSQVHAYGDWKAYNAALKQAKSDLQQFEEVLAFETLKREREIENFEHQLEEKNKEIEDLRVSMQENVEEAEKKLQVSLARQQNVLAMDQNVKFIQERKERSEKINDLREQVNVMSAAFDLRKRETKARHDVHQFALAYFSLDQYLFKSSDTYDMEASSLFREHVEAVLRVARELDDALIVAAMKAIPEEVMEKGSVMTTQQLKER